MSWFSYQSTYDYRLAGFLWFGLLETWKKFGSYPYTDEDIVFCIANDCNVSRTVHRLASKLLKVSQYLDIYSMAYSSMLSRLNITSTLTFFIQSAAFSGVTGPNMSLR
jgi:hypothetical protein